MVACELQNVRLIISLGADLNVKDFQGYTPLHRAVLCLKDVTESFDDYKAIIKELLFNGALRTVKNNEGQTPLEHAIGLEETLTPTQYSSIVRLLDKQK